MDSGKRNDFKAAIKMCSFKIILLHINAVNLKSM